MASVDMTRRSRTKIDDGASDVLRHAQSAVRARLCKLLGSSSELHEPTRHLGWEEAGSDGIAEDMLGTEFEGEVTGKMQDCGFGGGVGEGCVLAQGADTDTCYRGGRHDTRGIVLGCVLAKEWCESILLSVLS